MLSVGGTEAAEGKVVLNLVDRKDRSVAGAWPLPGREAKKPVRIRATATGKKVTLFANDRELITIEFPKAPRMGIWVSTGTVTFDEILVVDDQRDPLKAN
jgi:hypothetical protein